MDKGFRKVRPLAGGFDAWVQAGFDTDGTVEMQSTLPVRTVS